MTRIAATAANESWNPGSSTVGGRHASSIRAPSAIACQPSVRRDASTATHATAPATVALATDGSQPTASA